MLPRAIVVQRVRHALHVCHASNRQQAARQASTQAKVLSPEVIEKIIHNSRKVVTRMPSLRCNIAGVTFEGRQELVKQLEQFQGLLLIPEPSNVHDANAVAVMTVSGQKLGYVPREHNLHCAPQGTLPATVVGAGAVQDPKAASSPIYGATIWASPKLTPILPIPLPPAISTPSNPQVQALFSQTSPGSKAALTAARYACEVTGMSTVEGVPVVAIPRFRLDPDKKVAKLVRMAVVLEPLAAVYDLLKMAPGTPQYEQAVHLFSQLNSWRSQDVTQYLESARSAQSALNSETTWAVDTEPLEKTPTETTAFNIIHPEAAAATEAAPSSAGREASPARGGTPAEGKAKGPRGRPSKSKSGTP